MLSFGLNELIAELAHAAATAKPRAQRRAMETAEKVAFTMRTLVPVQTGALRDSIGVEAVPDGAEVGPTVSYAGFVEYGTSDTAPQPYADPAADAHEAAFIKSIEDIGEF